MSYFLSYLNPFSYFYSKSILYEYVELSEPRWFVCGEEVRIIRNGEDLNYLVVDPISGKKLRQSYIDKCGRSADEVIEYLKRGVAPEVKEDGNIDFVISFKSRIDHDTILTENQWAVTLVDVLASNSSASSSWGGHSVLLIERVIAKRYFMHKAHLCIKQGRPTVEYEEIKNFSYLSHIQERSETWERSAEKINKMLYKIEEEVSRQKQGKIGSLLNLLGRDSWFSRAKKVDGSLYQPDNCYTWLRDKLKLADLELVSERGIVITTPKANTNSKSIASKVAIFIALGGIKFIKQPINITEAVHNRLGKKRSWKVISSLRDNKCIINGRLFDNVSAKTTASLKRTFFDFILADVEPLHVYVKVRNEGLVYIDLTEYIENYIYSFLKERDIPKEDLDNIPWDSSIDSKYDGLLSISNDDDWDWDPF